MQGDIANEICVKVIAEDIKKKLERTAPPVAIALLKEVGRVALAQLETSPEWKSEYSNIFKE
jgi:hypothetical protein